MDERGVFRLGEYPWRMPAPEERTSVRVILIDPDERVLALGARDPDDGRDVWFLPGGGVEGTGIQHATERTQLGAFTRADYEVSLRRADLEPHYDTDGLLGRGLHLGVKGRASQRA